jgi:hypothetical protein
MLRNTAALLLLLAFSALPGSVFAQQKKPDPKKTTPPKTTPKKTDPAKADPKPGKKRIQKVAKRVKGWVYQNPGDTIVDKKSEAGYTRYQGKIIRKIVINHVGFEHDINDTTRYRVVNSITRVANSLHTDTKITVIKNNLFIKENKPLDPYKLADNERYLRDLSFILDARILVKPVRGNRDMVDVFVYTRDVFSIGGSFSVSSQSSVRFKVYDANLSGWGQRTEFRGLVDTDREPQFGTQLLYSKNSIKGTFINGTASYTQLNSGASYGLENESAVYVRLDRPLVSPYSRWAGGIEFSRNWSVNAFNKVDTAFRSYTYYVKDFWIGYNIGIKQKVENRNRYFVGVRTFGQSFSNQPEQFIEEMSPIYNNQKYVLGTITFYNQNFYRTKYVYGFGRTEDVPYGTRISFLAGQVRQLGYSRPYIGLELDKSVFRKNGDFRQYSLRAGGLRNGNELEDITLLASASLFSRLLFWKSLKIRQSVNASYTTILNQRINLPLRIDNEFGLEKFAADSVLGTQRLSIGFETVIYLKPSLLGFHFAPFIFTDMSMLSPKNETLIKQKPFFALGGGIRTRNENLIFGTIELRMFYFPRVTEDLSKFRITLSSNLRVKYSSAFVKAPAFIQYN